METHIASRPTGRRTLTPAKLAALDHPPPRPGGPGKCEASAAFRRAAPALDAIGLVPLIDLLMSRSFPQDWTGGGRPMVWVSNEWLRAHLGVGESRLKQLIGAAFEAGLIAMRESGNGHRGGGREGGEGGRILWAFGFDLSPLAARRDEFRELADVWERHEATVRRLRADLSGLRRAVLTLADLGRTTAPDAADWADVEQRARQVAGRGRGQRDADVLRMLADQLAAMRDEAGATLGAETESGAETAKSDPTGSVGWPLNTTASQLEGTKEDTKAGGQVQSRPGPIAPPPATERTGGPVDVLGDFPATPVLVLAVAPAFRAFLPNDGPAKPTREGVIEAAWHVRGHFGISQALWAQVCQTFGRWEAAVALAAVAGRHAAGQVRSPGGLLCRMLELHGRGELRLDRTLRGLAARLAEAADGGGGSVSVRPAAGSREAPPPCPPSTGDTADGATGDSGTPAPPGVRQSFDERVREALARARGQGGEAPPRDVRLHGGIGPTPGAGLDSGRRGMSERRR